MLDRVEAAKIMIATGKVMLVNNVSCPEAMSNDYDIARKQYMMEEGISADRALELLEVDISQIADL